MILAGVAIPSERGALGHSDADVLAHAVCDALLGAAALGDLGAHFPDSDPQWKDADSMALLARCFAMARNAGYAVGNLDATVILERPKLAAHIATMRANLAAVLEIDITAVSVKAKTSEGMGYTGDGTGLAVHAVACLTPI